MPPLRPLIAAAAALGLAVALPAFSAVEAPGTGGWAAPELTGHPLVGEIRDAGTGVALSPDDLLDRAAAVPYVILGERHDNPDHHAIQAWVTQGLVQRGRRPAVVYEMFETDEQPTINAVLADGPADAAGLGPAVDWAQSGWPAWDLYRPMADTAVAHGLPVLAGNLPVPLVRDIARQGLGSVDDATVERLGLLAPDGPAVQAAMMRDVRDGHCNLMPEEALAPMVTVQRGRDAMMAAKMREGLAMDGTDQAVLIAGNGHARTDRGVPLRLREMGVPAADILVIAPMEVREGQTMPAAYAAQWDTDGPNPPFDILWFTPRMEGVDHCAALRARMEERQQ